MAEKLDPRQLVTFEELLRSIMGTEYHIQYVVQIRYSDKG